MQTDQMIRILKSRFATGEMRCTQMYLPNTAFSQRHTIPVNPHQGIPYIGLSHWTDETTQGILVLALNEAKGQFWLLPFYDNSQGVLLTLEQAQDLLSETGMTILADYLPTLQQSL